jgi:SpoVK/Ycf46/Vps4 family AAA+-type ATPase
MLGKPALLKTGAELLGSFVGQTEQLIAEAFQTARHQGAVLIIDEADSFLASRGDAHRNWEVSQVNELLQQMEAFDDGIFVATTNLLDRLDEASFRRFDLKVAFRFLEPAQILLLLRNACAQLGLTFDDHPSHLRGLERLTPGDFSALMRQARFHPIQSMVDLCERLRAEQDDKRTAHRPIGFHAPVH